MSPLRQFEAWYQTARSELGESANIVALATAQASNVVSPAGHAEVRCRPSVRFVKFRGVHDERFRFFTNYEGRKARELEAQPFAAMAFHWRPLSWQVRIEGRVERTSAEASDQYFRTRSRASQCAVYLARQSATIDDATDLAAEIREVQARFSDRPIPRPPWWGGYDVRPDAIELSAHHANRLHERWRYEREGPRWRRHRLAP